MTKAPYIYDHGDNARMTPLLAMHSLGHDFIPPPVHAGGLRYHGMAPLVSAALQNQLMTARSYHQNRCYEAAVTWARTEGFVPAPETSHALAAAIEEAERAKEEGKARNILICYSGHGLMDLVGFEKYFAGELQDYDLPQEMIERSLAALQGYPRPE